MLNNSTISRMFYYVQEASLLPFNSKPTSFPHKLSVSNDVRCSRLIMAYVGVKSGSSTAFSKISEMMKPSNLSFGLIRNSFILCSIFLKFVGVIAYCLKYFWLHRTWLDQDLLFAFLVILACFGFVLIGRSFWLSLIGRSLIYFRFGVRKTNKIIIVGKISWPRHRAGNVLQFSSVKGIFGRKPSCCTCDSLS